MGSNFTVKFAPGAFIYVEVWSDDAGTMLFERAIVDEVVSNINGIFYSVKYSVDGKSRSSILPEYSILSEVEKDKRLRG